jgi:hypothetical protein
MKKTELIALIREVVKKEMRGSIKKQVDLAVQKQLNEIFINKGKEALFNAPTSQPTNFAEMEPPVTMTEAIAKETMPPARPKTNIDYVADPMLNSILNSTEGGIPQGDGMPGATVMPENVTEALREQYGGNLDDKTKLEIGAVQSIKNQGVNVDDVPEGVRNNLVRNYSDVLNKSKQITDRKQGKI